MTSDTMMVICVGGAVLSLSCVVTFFTMPTRCMLGRLKHEFALWLGHQEQALRDVAQRLTRELQQQAQAVCTSLRDAQNCGDVEPPVGRGISIQPLGDPRTRIEYDGVTLDKFKELLARDAIGPWTLIVCRMMMANECGPSQHCFAVRVGRWIARDGSSRSLVAYVLWDEDRRNFCPDVRVDEDNWPARWEL